MQNAILFDLCKYPLRKSETYLAAHGRHANGSPSLKILRIKKTIKSKKSCMDLYVLSNVNTSLQESQAILWVDLTEGHCSTSAGTESIFLAIANH